LRPDEIRLRHMFDATQEALAFTSNKTRSDLDSNRMLSLALVRLFEIIGAAAAGLSEGFKKQHSDVPWKQIIGMRHRLIHGYFDVDLDIVWQTITNDLPMLQKQLAQILKGIK